MKIINQSSHPIKLLKQISFFCKPKKLKRITIIFKNRNRDICCSGVFHPLINTSVIFVPKKPKRYLYPFLYTIRGNRGYIDHIRLDFDEDLVHVVAHELRHALQNSNPKIHRVYVHDKFLKEKKYSERDADAYAIKKQREWRRLQNIVIEDPVRTLEITPNYYRKK